MVSGGLIPLGSFFVLFLSITHDKNLEAKQNLSPESDSDDAWI